MPLFGQNCKYKVLSVYNSINATQAWPSAAPVIFPPLAVAFTVYFSAFFYAKLDNNHVMLLLLFNCTNS